MSVMADMEKSMGNDAMWTTFKQNSIMMNDMMSVFSKMMSSMKGKTPGKN